MAPAPAPLLSAADVARVLLAGWAACALLLGGVAAAGSADIAAGAEGDLHAEATAEAHAKHSWSYEGDNGPDDWLGVCQTGKIQSPIDIVTEKAKNGVYDPLVILHSDKMAKGVIKNNGHTAVVSLEGSHSMVMSGAGLKKKYRLEQIHFHWASEHTLNGIRYAFEAHFVFYDVREGSFESALHVPKSIAVLGVLFRESEKHNPVFDRVNVTGLAAVGSNREVTCSLKDLLPENKENYYRYRGSLTTPPCTEQVTWTVFADTLHISRKQLAEFRKLSSADGEPMVKNYRPIQMMRNHSIFYHELSPGVGANERRPSTILIITFMSVTTAVKLL